MITTMIVTAVTSRSRAYRAANVWTVIRRLAVEFMTERGITGAWPHRDRVTSAILNTEDEISILIP